MYRRITVGLALLMFAAPVAATASAATPRAAAVAALEAQVNAAAPSAQAQVAQAEGQGQAAVAALVNRLSAATPQPNGAPTPQEYALMQALLTAQAPTGGIVTSAPSTLSPPTALAAPARMFRHRVRAQAAASGCWFEGSHTWTAYRWYEAGVKVGDIAKNHNFWCGNGYSITSNGLPGFYDSNWAQFPWCTSVSRSTAGWDGPNYSWAHGIISAGFGGTTPWGSCATVSSGSAALRIAGSGYWDGYNDF